MSPATSVTFTYWTSLTFSRGAHAREFLQVKVRANAREGLPGEIVDIGRIERAEACHLGRGLRQRDGGEGEEVRAVGTDGDVAELQESQRPATRGEAVLEDGEIGPGAVADGLGEGKGDGSAIAEGDDVAAALQGVRWPERITGDAEGCRRAVGHLDIGRGRGSG